MKSWQEMTAFRTRSHGTPCIASRSAPSMFIRRRSIRGRSRLLRLSWGTSATEDGAGDTGIVDPGLAFPICESAEDCANIFEPRQPDRLGQAAIGPRLGFDRDDRPDHRREDHGLLADPGARIDDHVLGAGFVPVAPFVEDAFAQVGQGICVQVEADDRASRLRIDPAALVIDSKSSAGIGCVGRLRDHTPESKPVERQGKLAKHHVRRDERELRLER